MNYLTVSLIVLASLGGGVLVLDHSTVRSVQAAPTEAKTVQITARRFSFEPAELTLKQGTPVTLVLHSADVAHGLRVRELNLDIKAAKGASAQATITPDKAGDFVGHCSTFCGAGHGSMTLTVHVLP